MATTRETAGVVPECPASQRQETIAMSIAISAHQIWLLLVRKRYELQEK